LKSNIPPHSLSTVFIHNTKRNNCMPVPPGNSYYLANL